LVFEAEKLTWSSWLPQQQQQQQQQEEQEQNA